MVESSGIVDKKIIYEALVGKDPDVFYILSGSTRQRINKKGKRVGVDTATSYADSDGAGALGGKARAFAVAELASFFPNTQIYTNSESPGHISWEVMQRELEAHGVNKEKIKNGKDALTTVGEVVQMVELAEENGWEKVRGVTNEHHVERATSIFDHLEDLRHLWGDRPDFERVLAQFRSRDVDVRFIAAEPILETRNPRYKALIAQARNTPEYQKRVASEARGVDVLKTRPWTYGLPQPSAS